MTITELIEILKTVPGNTPVLLRGYEGGYYSPRAVGKVKDYVKDYYEEWYYGPHEEKEYLTSIELLSTNKESFKAVVLY